MTSINTSTKQIHHSLLKIFKWGIQQLFLLSDDGRIMTFLRGCKFSLEKTKRKLDMYFTMRTAVPEFFSDRDPTKPEIQEIFKIA